MKKNSREAWKLLHRLEGKSSPTQPPLVKPQAISSVLTRNFKIKIDKLHAKMIKKDLQQIINTCKPHTVFTERFSIDDVSNAINELKKGKAPGKDKIHPEFLHSLGPKARLWLANVLFEIFDSGKIPRNWKSANIIALLKPGKSTDNPASYHPIALLSVLSKLMERIILKKIAPLIEPHIPIHQAGFRPQRSCCDQFLALTSYIEKGYNDKLKSGATFIDLSAAYDTVWKNGLLWKLSSIIPCPRLISYIRVNLENRNFRVFLGNQKSRTRTLNNGLPQGSVLAPTLFNVYTHDIP